MRSTPSAANQNLLKSQEFIRRIGDSVGQRAVFSPPLARQKRNLLGLLESDIERDRGGIACLTEASYYYINQPSETTPVAILCSCI